MTADIVELARQYGRYGYRKIAEMLRTTAGWVVNDKRVEIWRREGLKVPAKQPRRGRLVTDHASACAPSDHVWSYDFVEDRTHDGRKYRMLNVIDEFTHESLAIRIERRLRSTDVIDVLSDLFILRGVPGHIRSDNGPEFIAKAVQDWSPQSARRQPTSRGSPWENGFIESFNARLRDAGWRNLLLAARGKNRDRKLATSLQHRATPRIAINHRPRRSSSQRWRRGRLRKPDRYAAHTSSTPSILATAKAHR